jgi:hypothetical protein
MDNRLNDALAFANYRLTLQVQRQNIEARVNSALLFSFQNAIFKATPELISYFDCAMRLGSKTVFIEDQSSNVIEITDTGNFMQLAFETYQSALQLKQQEQHRLKSARSTAKIVGL